jgi:hypothetical protein
MKRSVLAACILLCLAPLPGCGQGSSAADELERLPGVRAATVHKQALDTDYYGYTAVVDMDADASAPEIVGALDGLAEWFTGRGGDDGVRLYVGGGSVAVHDGWGDEGTGTPTAIIASAGTHRQNVANADLLLRATDVLDAPVTVRDYGWDVLTDEPGAALRKVLADPSLASAPGVRLTAPLGPVTDDFADQSQRPTKFGSSEPVRKQHLTTYDAAVANERKVREGQAHVSFVGSDPGVEPSLTDEHPGAIEIRMDLRLPGMAGPRELAADPLADPRWPVVAAQLDVLRTLPEGSRFSADLEWGRAPEGGPGHLHWLVDLGVGDTRPGQPHGAWQDAAFAYLNR